MNDLGGPAFPQVELDQSTGLPSFQHFGMTLRDYFAAKALQGDWAAANAGRLDGGLRLDANRYYNMADAMIEARKDV